MSRIGKRIAALEASKPAVVPSCHRVMIQPGEMIEDVVAAYGAERIGPHDHLIVRAIIDPPSIPRSPAKLEIVR